MDRMINEDVNNSPIVQLVNNMLEQAVRQRASDIHIEALERKSGFVTELMAHYLNVLHII